jgi:hypothetical protein
MGRRSNDLELGWRCIDLLRFQNKTKAGLNIEADGMGLEWQIGNKGGWNEAKLTRCHSVAVRRKLIR